MTRNKLGHTVIACNKLTKLSIAAQSATDKQCKILSTCVFLPSCNEQSTQAPLQWTHSAFFNVVHFVVSVVFEVKAVEAATVIQQAIQWINNIALFGSMQTSTPVHALLTIAWTLVANQALDTRSQALQSWMPSMPNRSLIDTTAEPSYYPLKLQLKLHFASSSSQKFVAIKNKAVANADTCLAVSRTTMWLDKTLATRMKL